MERLTWWPERVARRSGPAVDALVNEKSLFEEEGDDSGPSELPGIAPRASEAAAGLATEALAARAWAAAAAATLTS